MMPSPEEKNRDVFIALLAADTNRTVYTDLIGKFPVTSISEHKYVMVLYHYDSNGIIFRPMKKSEALISHENPYFQAPPSITSPRSVLCTHFLPYRGVVPTLV